jgi:UDP-N-acetylglucosamine diphosphorylase/glucosamine-1-phosphate N-acetyltransferase
MTGIVLAAGKSKRMGGKVPKVLLSLKGRPLLGYVIAACRRAGINHIVAVIGDRREQIERRFPKQGLEFVVQAEQKGTADAVLSCAGAIPSTETVVVLSGDVPLLRPATLRKLVRTLRREKADLSLLTAEVEDPSGYGRIVRDRAGRIQRIVEEKDATARQKEIREMNVGLYAFNWGRALPRLRAIPRSRVSGEYYLTRLVDLTAGQGGKVCAVPTRNRGEFMGVNTPADLRRVRRELERRRCAR